MADLVTLIESAMLSFMLSATFWNAVTGYLVVGTLAFAVLVGATAAALTTVFVMDDARDRARIRRMSQ